MWLRTALAKKENVMQAALHPRGGVACQPADVRSRPHTRETSNDKAAPKSGWGVLVRRDAVISSR